MMLKESTVDETHWNDVPVELMMTLDLEARLNGQWVQIGSIEKNKTRLIKFNFDRVEATAVRINLKETYGAKTAKLFEVRCYS